MSGFSISDHLLYQLIAHENESKLRKKNCLIKYLKVPDDEMRKRKCRGCLAMLQVSLFFCLLLPRCHFESIHPSKACMPVPARTYNKHYHLHSQINLMAGGLNIKKLIMLTKGPRTLKDKMGVIGRPYGLPIKGYWQTVRSANKRLLVEIGD